MKRLFTTLLVLALKVVAILLLNLAAVASAQITWNRVWPPVNDGTHNPPNGYQDIVWDAYSGKVWIYSTNGTNSSAQIYSIRLHYFDPVAVSDTNIGDNGQTNGGSCFTSTSTWPATHHAVGQFWVDAIRHRLYTIQGVACTEEVLEQWYYKLLNPISGNAWTEVFPRGLATNHPGEVGPWQSTFQNTTLSAALGSSDASMSLTNPSYAVNQDFYLIDSEIVRITANANLYLMGSGTGSGANPLTIVRGQYGTVAATHSSGATVERISGTFNNGKVVHDTYHDAFFWFGQRNDNSYGQLFAYCDTNGTGTLSSAQSSVGCTRPDDWVDITSKSICADAAACTASNESGTNGTNSGRLPHGWYYPSMDFDPASNRLILFAGGVYNIQYQYSFVYDPDKFTWTRLTTTCSGPHCTGLLSLAVTAGGFGYTTAPGVNINGCSGASAIATLYNGSVASLTITNMGTACSSPTVSFSGGGGSGASATAIANTLNAPPVFSSNSENTRIAHAVFQGKMYYHLSQHAGANNTPYGYIGQVQDWVLDPVAQTWTELAAGAGPTYTETMTVDPATGNLYAWAAPTSGSDAEIWKGSIGGSAAPVISSTSPINPGTQTTAYSFSFAATGTLPINWSVTTGNLPPGLTLSSSGVLSGTPTSAGTYTFSVQATNSVGVAGPQTYSLTITALSVGSAPAISSTSPLPQAVQSSPYTYNFTATGTTPITWTATGLPAGLSMTPSGLLSGTSAQSGLFTIGVAASNPTGTVNGTFSLTAAASGAPAIPSALGHSTYNCLDVDGDGYGVGPGCLGPDADDTDATVHSASDVLAKWPTLAAFWSHMGWSPTNVLYLDGGAGSCTAIATPFVYDPAKGCGTIAAAITAMSAGYAVVIRAGTYSQGAATLSLKTGTLSGTACTAYTYYLAYPGELADVEFAGGVMSLSPSASQSCFFVDGIKWNQNSHGVGRGFGASLAVPMYGWSISHNEVSGFTDNVFPQYNQHGTQIVHNYIHDAYAGGDFGHNIYLGSNVTDSGGTTIFGNIISNADDTCIHMNGPMTNITVDSNLVYGCSKGINNQSGISHSTFQNNVVHTNGRYLFQLNTYASSYSSNTWECHDENYNVIRNNVFFEDAQSFDLTRVSIDAGSTAIYAVDGGGADAGGCQAAVGHVPDLGHNTYDNNILIHNCGTNCYEGGSVNPLLAGPVIRYSGTNATTWLQSDTWRNNVLKNFDVATSIIDPGSGSPQNCAWFTNGANVPGSGNLCDSDPQFVANNPAWSTAGANWNLSLQSSSPAVAAGLGSDAPPYDILGSVRGAVPTIGAYDLPNMAPTSACDLNGDGVVNSADVEIAINAALGIATCTNAIANLTGNGCSVVGVQRVIDAAMGGACVSGR